jgi:hypothetical protein
MKKLTLLVFVILAFALNINAQDYKVTVINEINPQSLNLAPIARENDYPNAIYDLLRNHNIDSLIGTNVSYGVCWTGTNFVTARFSFNMFNKESATWTKLDSFSASGAGTGFFRDLAYANGRIWGSTLNNTIYGINAVTGVMEKTIVTTGTSIRALTYDPVRKGFWCGTNSFTGPLVCFDTNGVLIAGTSITMPASGCYGVAYDDDPAGPFLWVSTDQTPASPTGVALVKFNATTLAQIGTPINITVPLAVGAPNLSSGGCEVTTSLIPGKRTLVGLVQATPDRVYVVELGNTAPPVPTGTWTEQTSGITTALYSVSAVSDNVAWIGGAAGKVIKTINSGSTWTNAAGNLPVQDVYCIYGFDANNAVLTTSPSTGTFIYKTVNGGTNWTQVFSETGGFGDGLHFINATTGFFYGDPVGARWSLWKTTNAGTTWDSTGLYVPSAGAAGWNNAMYGRGSKIWFGSNAVNLPYSSNSGATWANQTTPAANQYAIWFNDDNVGLSGGANLNVTTNSGTTWTALTSIGTGNVSGIVGASTSWWFTRQTTAVNFSSNNGTSWAAQYTAPAGNFYHLALSRSGATIWGIRSNGGISRYGTVTGINPISTETPSNYFVSQNYPNPFNPATKINFALPKSGLVTLKVYDITGKEVATLVNEVKNVGTYSVDFNGANLSSGMYFYKISVNGFSEVKKMSLIK